MSGCFPRLHARSATSAARDICISKQKDIYYMDDELLRRQLERRAVSYLLNLRNLRDRKELSVRPTSLTCLQTVRVK